MTWRYKLSYNWKVPGILSEHFAYLSECRQHVRGIVQRPVRIYDHRTGDAGTLYPSGYIRWNRPERQGGFHDD